MSDYLFCKTAVVRILATFTVAKGYCGAALCAEVRYLLSSDPYVDQIYSSVAWLPEPYQKHYEGQTTAQVIELVTRDSLGNDGIDYDSAEVFSIPYPVQQYTISIQSDDPNAAYYRDVHPAFVRNNLQALIGVNKCQKTPGCWNKNSPHPDKPWALLPQFGLPMAMQKSVLMLNYPPTTALTEKNYLDTFTIRRWFGLMTTIGIENPVLFETIVDVRPIAAPGSGTSMNFPDAQTYFHDPLRKTGGYYVTPQLDTMLNPPANVANKRSLPLVVLGGPARGEWQKITGLSDDVLSTGAVKLYPGASKETPYILGNHPDVTTYQCCLGDTDSKCNSDNLIEMEETDLQVTCWAQSMSATPTQNPTQALADCKQKWVADRSADNNLKFCAQARIDSNECFGQDINWEMAIKYCQGHDQAVCNLRLPLNTSTAMLGRQYQIRVLQSLRPQPLRTM